ncbi:MAG TPA: glycosyltransferase family A protein, partial [Vicinamibacterales bacterium]|nr:glycosyltransferase family A protein [Vicinamibacterales bacterium]
MTTAHSLRYVLVTPARNEEAYLERTIESVVSQTIKPVRWVIVSDGSTDRTDEIGKRAAAAHPWIELVRMPERRSRDFAGKVGAFKVGRERLAQLEYDVIGSLDADITFVPEYFEYLLDRFAEDPNLGLAGTPFDEGGKVYDYRFSSLDHVSGACQLFRRACYEEIGGYQPLEGGGIDVVAVLSARMTGWRTQTFTEQRCIHLRPMGSANHGVRVVAFFKLGERAYRLGFHPLWQVCRSLYQTTRQPYVTGGAALAAGYFSSMIRRARRPISKELIA